MAAVNPKTRLEVGNRNLPLPLRKILEWDVIASKRFVEFLLKFKAIVSFRRHCKFLEWSCHGAVWLSCWIAFCYLFNARSLYQTQIHMLVGLLLDIVLVALIKAATRRRRPTPDDNPLSFGPDKFSFPSGHASRAAFVACFFIGLAPITFIFWPPIIAWTGAVCLSRLVLRRHHILDVIAGIGLGLFEALVMSVVWLNEDTCASLIGWISDDKTAGSDV